MFNYHVTIILATDSLIWGNCSCVLHLAMNSHPSTSCAYTTRSVIHRERITCRTRRFICGKIKNKHRAGDLRRKKEGKWIEGDLRSIKVSPGNVASSSLPLPPLSVTSDPLRAVRSNFYKRVECPRRIYYPS